MLISMLASGRTHLVVGREPHSPWPPVQQRYVIQTAFGCHSPLNIISKDKTRTTLTMDDLSAALAEYGINARKPDYYL
jgi:hypothetical protein